MPRAVRLRTSADSDRGATRTRTPRGSTFVASIRHRSVSTHTRSGLGHPSASLIVSIDPTIVAAITETTSCGTPSRVHAARTVPVRRIRRATSIPASGWIVEKIAGPARSSIPSFENSVVSLLPRALAPE